MLFTLLNWLYILITCYICGSFVLRRFQGHEGTVSGSIMCGIAVLTAYSEYFSLFAGVGFMANILLVFACIVLVFIDRSKFRESCKSYALLPGKTDMKPLKILAAAVSLAVIIITAYFTAASAFTYDTGTYHAQSIHWIETYGLVKGLAHMQTRLGFNNAYFALSALFSFHFLGQSMHALSGFLAAFVMVYSVRGLSDHLCDKRQDSLFRVSDFAYLAPFAYFIIIAREMTSPSTDFGVIWMILWLLIRWIECIETDTEKIHVFSLLSVFSVFLISVKLSVGVLALVTLYPLFYLVREKKNKEIGIYMLSGLVLILPFFIRNYYITGWLVYPFPAVDIFNPDWKVPLEGVKHEADEVVVWARYVKDTALIDQSIKEWFPIWWHEQGVANRFLSVSAFAGSALILLRIMISLVSGVFRRTGQYVSAAYTFFGTVLLISFLFFMLSAPSNRFGYAYILMIPLYCMGDLLINLLPGLFDKNKIIKVSVSILVAALLAPGLIRGLKMFASDDKAYVLDTGISGWLIKQRDYPEADSESAEWEGMTVYYPVNEGEQIWYHAFPAILYKGNLKGTVRRGNSVRDGFKLK